MQAVDPQAEVLRGLAPALEYPRQDTAALARAHALSLEGGPQQAIAETLLELADWLDDAPLGEAEERYTQLFDMKPVCTLNLGHHIFGDTYARGALLAGLAGELNRHEVAHRFDLPDFLPTMLRLLAQMQDEEDRQLLVHSVMIPALKKVITALEQSPGPWPELLRRLPLVLKHVVPKGSALLPKLQRPLEVLSC